MHLVLCCRAHLVALLVEVWDLLGGGLSDLSQHGLEPLLLHVKLLASSNTLELHLFFEGLDGGG